MPKASKATASEHVELEGYEGHLEKLEGGYTVAFERYTADADLTPFFRWPSRRPLPGPALGLRDQGKVSFKFAGRDETFETGDAYFRHGRAAARRPPLARGGPDRLPAALRTAAVVLLQRPLRLREAPRMGPAADPCPRARRAGMGTRRTAPAQPAEGTLAILSRTGAASVIDEHLSRAAGSQWQVYAASSASPASGEPVVCLRSVPTSSFLYREVLRAVCAPARGSCRARSPSARAGGLPDRCRGRSGRSRAPLDGGTSSRSGRAVAPWPRRCARRARPGSVGRRRRPGARRR